MIENLRRCLQIYGIAEAFPAEGGETMLSVRDIVKVVLPEEIVAAILAVKIASYNIVLQLSVEECFRPLAVPVNYCKIF